MKTPIGAPSRSVNPFRSLKDEIIRRAQADQGGLESSIAKIQSDRYDRRTKQLRGRTDQELAEAAAAQLNRMDVRRSTPMSARDMYAYAGAADAANVTPDDILRNLQSLDKDERSQFIESMAANGRAGLIERLRQAQLYANEQLQAKGARGHVARAGVVTAATGGVVMGLTPAGQGLMALMEYMQNGGQQEEAREYPLS